MNGHGAIFFLLAFLKDNDVSQIYAKIISINITLRIKHYNDEMVMSLYTF